MATALEEMRGGSVDATIASGDYRCRLDSGPGGCRLYVVRPQTAGCTFTLPNPAHIRPGAEANFVVINKGPNSISIRSNGATPIYTLAANRAVEIRIAVQDVDTWVLAGPYVVSSGTALNGSRKPYELTYTASNTKPTLIDLDLGNQFGYRRSDGPVALQVTIKSNVVLGSDNAAGYAVYTGAYPAGSTMLMILESGAIITGAGGTGGTGQTASATGMTAGTNGGGALAVYCNTTLVNGGRVQGGGGGGGGAARRLNNSVYLPGGSGGGGAGALAGNGGPAIGNPADPSTAGQAGSLLIAGNGGQTNISGAQGGQGGGPGQNGSAGQAGATAGAAGGSSGAAIGTATGFTLTKLVAGTILGSEITL